MKKIILVMLGFAIVMLIACGTPALDQAPLPHMVDSTFKICVIGNEGQPFTGSYSVIKSNGATISRSVDGIIPAEYEMDGHIVSCVFQKSVDVGTLQVIIYKNGTPIATQHTMAAYGIVSIATQ